jgi:hypothetical protein
MPAPALPPTAAHGATMLAFHCVRNSSLEDLHAGIFPSSQTGASPDGTVVSPDGERAWHRLARIRDEAMPRLSEDVVNRLYTFLFYRLTRGEPDRARPLPHHWSPPHIEASIAAMWPEGRVPARDAHQGYSSAWSRLLSCATLRGPQSARRATRVIP